MIKNAYLSLKKNYGKTFLLLCIMFLIANLVIAGFSIKEASDKTAIQLRQTLGNDVTLSIDFRNMMKDREIGQPIDQTSEQLTIDVADTLKNISYVESVNYTLSVNVNSNLSLVSTEENNMPDMGDRMNQNDSLSINANSSMENLSVFKDEDYVLLEGELLTSGDDNSCMIETNLAKENSLSLGDEITVSNFQDSSISKTLKITGIFEVVNSEMGFGRGRQGNPVNTIYTDLSVGQYLNNSDAYISSAIYYLDDPEHFELFEEEAKKTEIDFEIYSLQMNNQLYVANQRNIESVSGFAKLFLIIVIAAGCVILSLIIALSQRSRHYEFGVFLSLGQSKLKIILQQLIEVLLIASIALILSLGTGKMTSNIISSQLSKQNEPEMQEREFGKMRFSDAFHAPSQELDVSITVDTVMNLIIVSGGICIVATILPAMYILRLSPREILVRRE